MAQAWFNGPRSTGGSTYQFSVAPSRLAQRYIEIAGNDFAAAKQMVRSSSFDWEKGQAATCLRAAVLAEIQRIENGSTV